MVAVRSLASLSLSLPVIRRADLRAQVLLAWRILSTRQHLKEMDARMLKDIGISRSQAMYEANRPIRDLLN